MLNDFIREEKKWTLYDFPLNELVDKVIKQVLGGNFTNFEIFYYLCKLPHLPYLFKHNEPLKLAFDTIYHECIKLESSNIYSQLILGLYFQYGIICKIDFNKAIKLYQSLMELEHIALTELQSYALTFRANMYRDGQGTRSNNALAIFLFEKAIGMNNVFAMSHRASMHFFGKGGPKDYWKALQLDRRAANLGSMTSTFNLGDSFEKGKGVDKDSVEAKRLYKKALDWGLADATNAYCRHLAKEHISGRLQAINLASKSVSLTHEPLCIYLLAELYRDKESNIISLQVLRLYEQALRLGETRAEEVLNDLLENSSKEACAKQIVSEFWQDLVDGEIFSKPMFDYLKQQGYQSVLENFKQYQLHTSLVYLKKLKSTPKHPLRLILASQNSQAPITVLDYIKNFFLVETDLNQSLRIIPEVMQLRVWILFSSSDFSQLPLEIRIKICEHFDPGFAFDRTLNYGLPEKLNYLFWGREYPSTNQESKANSVILEESKRIEAEFQRATI